MNDNLFSTLTYTNISLFDPISLKEQEYFGWVGNFIFIIAQLFQIHHTYKRKITLDISYGLQIMYCIGDVMYTVFGAIDKSLSMLVGNSISLTLACIQVIQKIYYDNYYYRHTGYEPIS